MIEFATAKEISETLSIAWDLPELDQEGEITLFHRLKHFENLEAAMLAFESEYSPPDVLSTNRKIERLIGLVHKLDKALSDESKVAASPSNLGSVRVERGDQ